MILMRFVWMNLHHDGMGKAVIGSIMYVTIDHKPNNGYKIQSAACGQSGVMLHLRLVKTAKEENANVVEDKSGNSHGTTG